jgi:hypothetical protein
MLEKKKKAKKVAKSINEKLKAIFNASDNWYEKQNQIKTLKEIFGEA